MTVEVTEATFEREVGASPVPVVVEFYATWCGKCRRIAPTLDELAAEFAPDVRFVKVNADENPDLVTRFGVSSTPTLFVLADGNRVTSVVGAHPAPILRALFDTAARTGEVCGCGPTCGAAPTATSAARPTLRTETRTMSGWVLTDACTLPTVEQPMRLAEFEELFDSSLRGMRRESSGWLRLWLAGGGHVASRARDLTAREAECCSFFDFTVDHDGNEVVVDVRVPSDREMVLDGLAAQAEAALSARL